MELTRDLAINCIEPRTTVFDLNTVQSVNSKRVFNQRSGIIYSTNKIINLLEKSVAAKIFIHSVRVDLKEGEYLYRPEEEIKYLYFPESAVIAGFQMLEDGRLIETELIGRDGITKPLALLNSKLCGDWTQVILAGTALRIKVQDLKRVFNESSSLQPIIFSYLQESYDDCINRIACNNFHLLAARLSRWLLIVHDCSKLDTFPVTHEGLARTLGAHRPNISKAAKSLQDKKIIKYARGFLTILDRRGLEENACSCYLLNHCRIS